ncbi:uncharacterized protein HMPREF1120_04184 [Exophiala dermatitidis NIH/UT8656]|uniref:Uncharacterized protein n=1 Tax=Exophiala dermatitidis (strain ATCC 34100 / CBS 525.76 / NIH/UT8656) TaxID=858893 RepID=H6BWM3_EXODN|nr:uncharacterized protein HMPREF1120_04184 [Exophiala dermatitidis NIH/UT8656]EHY56084.1 hypothetical protein HMPREF1120_04184 [Exophiala dermatitidis NIH/UT8656]
MAYHRPRLLVLQIVVRSASRSCSGSVSIPPHLDLLLYTHPLRLADLKEQSAVPTTRLCKTTGTQRPTAGSTNQCVPGRSGRSRTKGCPVLPSDVLSIICLNKS